MSRNVNPSNFISLGVKYPSLEQIDLASNRYKLASGGCEQARSAWAQHLFNLVEDLLVCNIHFGLMSPPHWTPMKSAKEFSLHERCSADRWMFFWRLQYHRLQPWRDKVSLSCWHMPLLTNCPSGGGAEHCSSLWWSLNCKGACLKFQTVDMVMLLFCWPPPWSHYTLPPALQGDIGINLSNPVGVARCLFHSKFRGCESTNWAPRDSLSEYGMSVMFWGLDYLEPRMMDINESWNDCFLHHH